MSLLWWDVEDGRSIAFEADGETLRCVGQVFRSDVRIFFAGERAEMWDCKTPPPNGEILHGGRRTRDEAKRWFTTFYRRMVEHEKAKGG